MNKFFVSLLGIVVWGGSQLHAQALSKEYIYLGGRVVATESPTRLAMPVLSPDGANSSSAVSVTITATPGDAEIYYTLNGTDPTPIAQNRYSAQVTVSSTQTLKAIAHKTGYADSEVKSARFTIGPPAAKPVFAPGGATYPSAQVVAITSATSGAAIYYTLTGQTPVPSTSYTHQYQPGTPVTVSSTLMLSAIATKDGYSNSEKNSELYTIADRVAPPVFSLASGSFPTTQSVSISTATVGATIHYTDTGTAPTCSTGYSYLTPVPIKAMTLTAIACKDGMSDSNLTSATYSVALAAKPAFSVQGGTFSSTFTVTISDTTSGASIYYTTNGSAPTATTGTPFTSAITVSRSLMLRAIATAPGYAQSDEMSANYVIGQPTTLKVTTGANYTQGYLNRYSQLQLNAYINGATTPSNDLVNWSSSDTSALTVDSTGLCTSLSATNNNFTYVTAVLKSNSTVTSRIYITLWGVTEAQLYQVEPNPVVEKMTFHWRVNRQDFAFLYSTAIQSIFLGSDSATPSTGCQIRNYQGAMVWLMDGNPGSNPVQVDAFYGTTPTPTAKTPVSGTHCILPLDTIYGYVHYDGTSSPSSTDGILFLPVRAQSTFTGTVNVYRRLITSSEDQPYIQVGTWEIPAPAAEPTVSLVGGTYSSSQLVTLSSTTPKAVIHYTTDGTAVPTATSGELYTGPVSITRSTTLKAVAYVNDTTNLTTSTVKTVAYVISTANPTFSPQGGIYPSAQTVTISSPTSGAAIRYTTNGTDPTTTTGTEYTGAITVSSSTTVKAIAYAANYGPSAVVSVEYKIGSGPTAKPVFSVSEGTYAVAQTVAITCGTTGAAIRYTLDGTAPTSTTGTEYTGAVTVSSTQTLKAIAYASGYFDSEIASATYTIAPYAAKPTLSPVGATSNNDVTVTISTTTSGATIRYTTNGVDPTSTTGTVYSAPVVVNSTTTVKAISVATGYTNSEVASATYTLVAAPPTFSPVAGPYTSVQTVTISSATSGASIRYTTNGVDPTSTSGTEYSGPITVSATTTLKAIAYKTAYADSAVVSAAYTITLPTAPPTFSPAAGTYTSAQTVTISSTTSGATIRYTTDGTTPTATTGTVYSAAITISATTTLKALAYKTGYTDSAVVSATYTLVTATPTFSVTAGTYPTAQTVSISTTTSEATIRYTTDGSTPTSTTGTVYSAPITVSATTTLKAIAFITGYTDSAVASATYTIAPYAATPTFSVAAGTYTASQTVTISTTTSGSAIRYTTDGTTPTSTSGTVYSSAITVSSTTTLKAIAYATGYTDSVVASATYTIAPYTATPTFSVAAGTYTASQTVVLSTTTSGATIRYTTDGTTPSSSSGTVYSAAVAISATTTLRAIAYATGYTDSAVASATYTIAPYASTPTFSVVAGTYNNSQTVTISSATSGATIRYTTDGTTPTSTTGTVYSAAIAVSSTTTLRAIAYKSGYTDSAVASATYTLVAATPTFSVAAGTYTASQTVTLSSTTSGAAIRYTTDGTTPTSTTGAVYSAAITVSATTTLKAIAYATSYTDSAVASATYTIAPYAATPTFSVAAGTYTASQTVTLSTTTSGAAIRYTTDGTTPTSTTGTVYSSAITISATTTLKAIAYKAGYTDSTVATATYTIAPAVAAPTFSVATGTYNNVQTVTISSTTSGATIRYTTNGTAPTSTNGTVLHLGYIVIDATSTLKAIAYKTGYTDSSVTSATYSFVAATPTFPGNTYVSCRDTYNTVNISTETTGANIRYTTDGSTPSSTNGNYYSEPFALYRTTSYDVDVKAIAYKDGYTASAVATGYYCFVDAGASLRFHVETKAAAHLETGTLRTAPRGLMQAPVVGGTSMGPIPASAATTASTTSNANSGFSGASITTTPGEHDGRTRAAPSSDTAPPPPPPATVRANAGDEQ
jgi:hypothetical protein